MSGKFMRFYDNIIPKKLCNKVIREFKSFTSPATIFDNELGQRAYSEQRTNSQALIETAHPLLQEVFERIQKKIPQPFERDWNRLEELTQFNHYAEGQEFQPHYDYLVKGIDNRLAEGQRDLTLIVYLNTPEEGGETRFPNLAQFITAQQGGVVLFQNVKVYSYHAGAPVIKGEKYILNTWTRFNP